MGAPSFCMGSHGNFLDCTAYLPVIYCFYRSRKQVRILYEPVAVRCVNVIVLARSRNAGTCHWSDPRRRAIDALSRNI